MIIMNKVPIFLAVPFLISNDFTRKQLHTQIEINPIIFSEIHIGVSFNTENFKLQNTKNIYLLKFKCDISNSRSKLYKGLPLTLYSSQLVR